jgi:Holliday junction resolvasome RuvABC endonuclease subunit
MAIDPGGVTGFARCDGTAGAWVIVPPRATVTRLETGAALARYRGELVDLLAEYRPQWLIVERTVFGSRYIEDYTYAAEWAAIEAAALHECRLAQMTAMQVRRHHWGPHKATDRERVAMAQSRGFVCADNHAADAALLLDAWRERARQDEAAAA